MKIVKETSIYGVRLGEKAGLNILHSLLQDVRSVTLVCDGLDDCDRDAQRMMCKALCSFTCIQGSSVKIMVTCREQEQISLYLNSFSQITVSLATSKEDIETYINSAVQMAVDNGELTLNHVALKKEIISKLIEGADAM